MAEIKDWVTLSCDCGGNLFESLVRLKFKTGGGTTTEPAGHRCIACNGSVDNARMIKLIEIQRAKQQISELQDELDASGVPSVPVMTGPGVKK